MIATLEDEYRRQPSLIATAKVFGVSSSHVHYLFKQYGIAARSPKTRARFFHEGTEYSSDGRGFYRRLTRGKQGITLHKVIWEARHGKVPQGHRLIFLSPNRTDFSDQNISCVPLADYYRHIGTFKRGRGHKQKSKL